MSKKNYLLSTLVLAGLITGCAKEREFEEVFKSSENGGLQAKASIDTEAEFLYVPTSQGVPRYTTAMAPFVQGKERIIKFKFEEDAIVAYQMEKDPSFTDNTLNNKPILKIPVSYHAYRCRLNSNDECTNEEEENSELEWFQKDKFVANFAGTQLLEADSLELPSSGDSCFMPIGDRLLKDTLEITKTDLNFTIEKTYKFIDTPSCYENLMYNVETWQQYKQQLEDNAGAINVRVHYSFAKLDSIASPNYEKVNYPVDDHKLFGFFTTEEKIKNDDMRTDYTFVMNRWNPERKVIDYHLSDEFNKKTTYDENGKIVTLGNEYLKEATYYAFDRMNKAMARDGVNLFLKLHEPSGKSPGSLRNTMIVLIEDIASGLLGYGPTVANPRTGEIVKGHTNMYKGSLESFAPYTYDSIVWLERELEREKNERPLPPADAEKALGMAGPLLKKSTAAERTNAVQNALNLIAKLDLGEKDAHGHNHKHEKVNKSLGKVQLGKRLTKGAIKEFLNRKVEFRNEDALIKRFEKANPEFTSRYAKQAKAKEILNRNSGFTSDMLNFQSLGKVSVKEINTVKGIRDEKGALKDWIELTSDQKFQLTKILAKHAYVPTLVHEIGHNLGLRHNFYGSVDKDNFYSEKERKELGIDGGSVYSSIMDYAYSSLNELSTFGKYDTAALKFAYNREVQLTNGSFVKLGKSTLLNKVPNLKKYGFCTDEDAGSMLTCNRFDEGSNVKEIMNHLADKYQENYYWRNLKNRRKNFNDRSGAWNYIVSTYYTMLDVRQIHEQWQSLHTYLGQFQGFEQLAVTGCSAEQRASIGDFCDYVQETKDANDAAGRFFLDIIKTPDLTCDASLTATIGGQEWITDARVPFVMSESMSELTFDLPNDKGSYKPWTCFDKNIPGAVVEAYSQTLMNMCLQATGNNVAVCQSQLQISAKVEGEVGKLHNDVDAADRTNEDHDSSDIEIRGNWIDKAFAMEFLTNKELLTTAGASNHISFVDVPGYDAEIDNLVRHLVYGEELHDPMRFTAANGMKYPAPFELDLSIKTKVPSLKWTIKNFIPILDKENFKFGPVLAQVARTNARSSISDAETEEEYRARNAFADSLTVYKNALNQDSDEFGDVIVSKTKDSTFEYGAAKRNTIAKELIDRLNGLQDEIATQISAIKKTVDDASVQPAPVPAPSEDDVATDDAASADDSTDVASEEPTQTGPQAEPTAGKELIEKVIDLKTVYATAKTDVDTLFNVFLEAQMSGQDINEAVGKYIDKVGLVRFQYAYDVFSRVYGEMSKEESELFENFSMNDLKYALMSTEDKVEAKKKLKAGLFGL
ncbi:zinc-dependent metalloprotease [Bacteriovorax sp. Seq25_V]|uniref:zinc-dependent metalloprotease n=1 Tax=Bacteriovorax sp. Seq25_V TaxID=1201288 RepID=UPI000389DC21|nr:zinc-dependent metalloprotease [Bacteriovorax sp. Seq25_V]EQC44352.1 putative lipoprotein [Bacteriovorax sp. Seq25_V]